MSIVAALIDKARARSGITSDNALAARFDLHRQSISKWRTGDAYPDEENIVELATMAGDDPAEWLVAIKAVRTDGAAGRVWSQLARKLGAAAAVVLLVSASMPGIAKGMVGRDGIEPSTNGLKVRCSTAELTTHWRNRPALRRGADSNPRRARERNHA